MCDHNIASETRPTPRKRRGREALSIVNATASGYGLLDETAIGTRGMGTAAGGARIHASRASAGAAEGRKGGQRQRARTTESTNCAKKEKTPDMRNALVPGILFVGAASLARMSEEKASRSLDPGANKGG